MKLNPFFIQQGLTVMQALAVVLALWLRITSHRHFRWQSGGDSRRVAQRPRRLSRAFTIVELLIVIAIIMTVSAIAVPKLSAARENAKVSRAVGDIRTLETEIRVYESTYAQLPLTLDDIGRGDLRDPWGNRYEFLNFEAAGNGVKGQQRKDRFLVPINSTYDLYSKGKDGESQPPLTAKASRDDIVRASDGGFVGLAFQY